MPFDGLTPERTVELEALLQMREMLAKPGGWCQGAAYRDGANCLVQAVVRAATTPELAFEVQNRLKSALPRFWWGRFTYNGLIAYNDRPSTTQADVVALIDRAIGAC